MKQHLIVLLLLYKSCQVLTVNRTSCIIQDCGVKAAKVGQTVTLSCSCADHTKIFIFWYKQSLGGKPHIISSRKKTNLEANIPLGYKKRFQVFAQTQDGTNNLIISDLQLSDSGTYYCGTSVLDAIEFGPGVFLHVKTSLTNTPSVIHQPAMEPVSLGDFVNLSCIVYAEQCEGEQNFYWFRNGVSQPAVMNPSDKHCTNLPDKKLHWTNCTLNLALKSVSSSDVGTYYCALVSCGETVFGDGTKVEIVGSSSPSSLLEFCLSLGFVVSIVVLLVLLILTYKLKSKLQSASKETTSQLTCSAASNTVELDADDLLYSAPSFRRSSERRHHEDTADVCVYSRVKSRKM